MSPAIPCIVELPDILAPFKHFESDIISGVLDCTITPDSKGFEDHPSESTMKHWNYWLQINKKNIDGILKSKGYQLLGFSEVLLTARDSLLEKLRAENGDWLRTIASIEETKTSAGTRYIPMTEEVRECFKKIITNRKHPKVEPIKDGFTGFLFYDKNNNPRVALNWEKYFHYALEKYNRIYRVQLPAITPYVCRHTYCSNMARAGMNPKTLQYLMGHIDIGVTLNTYTHLGAKDAKEELERLNLAGTSKCKMPQKVVNMS